MNRALSHATALGYVPGTSTWYDAMTKILLAASSAVQWDALARSRSARIGQSIKPDASQIVVVHSGSLNKHPWFAEHGAITGEVMWFDAGTPEQDCAIARALGGLSVRGQIGTCIPDATMRGLPVLGLLVEGVFVSLGGVLMPSEDIPTILAVELESDLVHAALDDAPRLQAYLLQLMARSLRASTKGA